jgi:hypothetical protein
MLVLSFPLGVLARPLVILTGFLAQMISLGSLVQINKLRDGVVWFFVLGYVQWFWLVPGLFGWLRDTPPDNVANGPPEV